MTLSHGAPERVPSAALLHYAALLSGFGTAFLGPSLPRLIAALHLTDRGAGALLAAQFAGAFWGGWTTRTPLHRCLLRGYTAATAGFLMLSVTLTIHAVLAWALIALFLLGFGIGQIITSNNLLASLRWSRHRGAALTLLNFTWSAGALCAPLLLPGLLARYAPAFLFGMIACLLFAGAVLVIFVSSHAVQQADTAESIRMPAGLPRSSFLYFCLLLFLYGGVETSLSGWLTTYDLRYTAQAHVFAASTAAFWFCLTGTRALISALLLRLPERPVLRVGLVLTVVTLTALLASGSLLSLPLLAGLIGASLAPWFPLVFSGLVAESPTAQQAGRIVAVSGLGAAALPWLVGQVSATTGSLRLGLLLPAAATGLLLLLSFRRTPSAAMTLEPEGV